MLSFRLGRLLSLVFGEFGFVGLVVGFLAGFFGGEFWVHFNLVALSFCWKFLLCQGIFTNTLLGKLH